MALHLNQCESLTSKDAWCQGWLKLAEWFLRRRWKCEKFTDGRTDGRTDRQTTDDRRLEKRTWAFSSGELKTFYFLKLGDFHVVSMMSCTDNANGIRKFRKGSRARTSIAWCSFYSKPMFLILKNAIDFDQRSRWHGGWERVKERRERENDRIRKREWAFTTKRVRTKW